MIFFLLVWGGAESKVLCLKGKCFTIVLNPYSLLRDSLKMSFHCYISYKHMSVQRTLFKQSHLIFIASIYHVLSRYFCFYILRVNCLYSYFGYIVYTVWQLPTHLFNSSLRFFSCLSRQGFSVQLWSLSWNLLCRPGWPRIQRSTCLCLPSAGIKGMHHHCQARTFLYANHQTRVLHMLANHFFSGDPVFVGNCQLFSKVPALLLCIPAQNDRLLF